MQSVMWGEKMFCCAAKTKKSHNAKGVYCKEVHPGLAAALALCREHTRSR